MACQAGYTIAGPEGSTFWICTGCFVDFRERFNRTVVAGGGEA